MLFPFSKLPIALISLLYVGCSLLRAYEGPTSFVLNLPFQANEATPIWMGHPDTPASSFAGLNIPILPPDSNASLLVTVLFQEKQGGFLRITWKGPQSAQVLSDNFYEGIAMGNQRSLLVPAQVLQGAGTLNFLCGDTSLDIQRIRLEWVENQTCLVSPQVRDLLITSAQGATQSAGNLNGQPKPAESAVWHDEIVNVPVTDAPERIEQGVEFNVQIDSLPGACRLALKESGLPFGKHLVVWINQQRAGTIAPTVPDLLDDGYLGSAAAANIYVGWRDGSFSVPVSLLKTGANALQFSVEDDVASSNGATTDATTAPLLPLAVKNVVLQLDFPPTSTQAQTSSTPTGPVTPPETPAPLLETN